jgi:formate-dependent nitrite reductase membrane component NrfD
MEWIMYPFAFIIQFIMTTLLIFVRISLMAFGGMFLLILLKRRGEYRHVWRTTAFAYTTPTVLSILFLYLGLTDAWIFIVTTIICVVYLALALKYYPQK